MTRSVELEVIVHVWSQWYLHMAKQKREKGSERVRERERGGREIEWEIQWYISQCLCTALSSRLHIGLKPQPMNDIILLIYSNHPQWPLTFSEETQKDAVGWLNLWWKITSQDKRMWPSDIIPFARKCSGNVQSDISLSNNSVNCPSAITLMYSFMKASFLFDILTNPIHSWHFGPFPPNTGPSVLSIPEPFNDHITGGWFFNRPALAVGRETAPCELLQPSLQHHLLLDSPSGILEILTGIYWNITHPLGDAGFLLFLQRLSILTKINVPQVRAISLLTVVDFCILSVDHTFVTWSLQDHTVDLRRPCCVVLMLQC